MTQARITKPFKVVAISGNTNSFGLNGMVLVAKDGEAYEAAKYNAISPLKRGDIVNVPISYSTGEPQWAMAGFEIPFKKPNAPTEVVNEIWKNS